MTPRSLRAQRGGGVVLLMCRGHAQTAALLVHRATPGGSLCVVSQDSRMEASVTSVGPQIMPSLLGKTNTDSSV